MSLPASSEQAVDVRCDGTVRPGEVGVCETEFWLDHFDGDDAVESFTAALRSLLGYEWRVEGRVWDATGTYYFGFGCDALFTLYSVTGLSHGCDSERPPFVNARGEDYTADVSGPQRLRVEARTEACAEFLLGCPFETEIQFLLHD